MAKVRNYLVLTQKMFRHPDHYVTDFQSLCGGDTTCIMQGWELQNVLPDKTLLDEMVCACLDKLRRQKRGLIRKSELGGFLKQKIGVKYRRGWLKQVVYTMLQKGLVQNAATPDMVKIQGAMMPKWCHFTDECKYLKDLEENHMHFKLFVHLCPKDSECPYVVACRIERMEWMGQKCDCYIFKKVKDFLKIICRS